MENHQRLLTAEEMSQLDRYTIEELKVPGQILMENAGFACARELMKDFPGYVEFAILCGKGNNGGDGYVIARHLHLKGRQVRIFMVGEPQTEDARVHYQICRHAGVPISPMEEFEPTEFDVGVDALFGTGLCRELSGEYQEFVSKLNQIPKVFCVDMPSGICSDTGKILGEAVSAYKTFTFQSAKRGHFLYPGCEKRGVLEIVDIGICMKSIPVDAPIVETQARFDLPERRLHTHKGLYGHLLCVGGASGKSGAICMAGKSALESGAGLVTVGSNSKTIQSSQVIDPSLMSMELSNSDEYFSEESLSQVLDFKKDVLLIGPGGGRDERNLRFFREVILKNDSPMVIDADALRAFHSPEDAQECLRDRSAPTILTPHPGEFSALTGVPSREIESRKLELAREFVINSGTTLVLKGASTVVALPSGQVRLFYLPNSALAKAGSGDVLAGIISALLCQGFSASESAFNGVRLHAAAGLIMSDDYTSFSSSPMKLIDSISRAIKDHWEDAVNSSP